MGEGAEESARLTVFMDEMRELVAKHRISGVCAVAVIGLVNENGVGAVTDATLGFVAGLPASLRHGFIEVFMRSATDLLQQEHDKTKEEDPSVCEGAVELVGEVGEKSCRPRLLN